MTDVEKALAYSQSDPVSQAPYMIDALNKEIARSIIKNPAQVIDHVWEAVAALQKAVRASRGE